MIKDEQLTTLLNSVIFDLERVLITTKEKSTHNTIKNVTEALRAIKADTESKEYINLIKRMVYNRMTDLKDTDKEKSLELYKIYQQLKVGAITPSQAIPHLND
jgi:hypothetical protein